MELKPTPFEALEAAVAKAGSQSALARICNVSQTAVWKWLQSGKRLPAEYVLAVEAETMVSRHHLRPDIYPLTLPTRGDVMSLADQTADVACDRQAKTQERDAA